jgi:hypothetical protein
MGLSANTLATELEKMTPTADEAVAAERLAEALRIYFAGGTIRGSTPVDDLSSAKSLAKNALTGMSDPGQGPAKIVAAVTAFWTDFGINGNTYWPVPPDTIAAIVPSPALVGLLPIITATFLANVAAEKSLPDCAAAVAADIHNSSIGNVVTITLSAGGSEVTTIS